MLFILKLQPYFSPKLVLIDYFLLIFFLLVSIIRWNQIKFQTLEMLHEIILPSPAQLR